EYMIPQYFKAMDKVPLTVNGKLDKRALPEIEYEREDEYIAPTTLVEETACNIFEEVLNIGQVSIRDNFFELGGHSLRAMRVINLLEESLGKRVELKSLFENPTPEGLARVIEEMEVNEFEPIPKGKILESYPMSSAQQRLFLINQLDETELSYNMPLCLAYEGKINEDNVLTVRSELASRHESLQTSYSFKGGEVEQKIAQETTSLLEKEEGNRVTLPETYLEEFVRPFDLSKAPLLRVKIIKTYENGGYLLFDMHHIISDGMSMNILVKDFCELYEGKELSPLNIQYKDYSQWMIDKDLGGQKDYWLDIYKEEPPVLDFPLDAVRPQIQSFEGDSV